MSIFNKSITVANIITFYYITTILTKHCDILNNMLVLCVIFVTVFFLFHDLS